MVTTLSWRRIVDAAIEAPVAPSFTRVGYDVRSRIDDWSSLDDYDMSESVILLTGGTSGLGRAAAAQLGRCGATVIITGRSVERTQEVAAELSNEAGTEVHAVAADMGDLDQVRSLAKAVLAKHDRLDVLIHNAGALSGERRLTSAGHEATVASQVYGPFLLTSLLLDRLSDADGRVLTMSSGGMYAANLSVDDLEMSPTKYKGATQYALAKRAQVTLTEMWAERHGSTGVHFHALHPGWADTPGVADALPGFGRLVGPLLRSPEQGADTLVWLAADDAAERCNGCFWLDRRRRSPHKTIFSRMADTPEKRAALWDLVEARALGTPG